MQNILSTSKMKTRKKIARENNSWWVVLGSGSWLLFATRANRVLWNEWVMKSKKFAVEIMIWLVLGVLLVLEKQFKKSFGTLSFLQKSLLVSYSHLCCYCVTENLIEINEAGWINDDHYWEKNSLTPNSGRLWMEKVERWWSDSFVFRWAPNHKFYVWEKNKIKLHEITFWFSNQFSNQTNIHSDSVYLNISPVFLCATKPQDENLVDQMAFNKWLTHLVMISS